MAARRKVNEATAPAPLTWIEAPFVVAVNADGDGAVMVGKVCLGAGLGLAKFIDPPGAPYFSFTHLGSGCALGFTPEGMEEARALAICEQLAPLYPWASVGFAMFLDLPVAIRQTLSMQVQRILFDNQCTRFKPGSELNNTPPSRIN